ncbi:MAG: polysaccharide deacetylase family protein [Chloroflexota bacterium]|nr:polysaccharide deacetylase family protein [Chloroflexota bacterium]
MLHARSAFSRRRLLHWGGAALLTGGGLVWARATSAVSLSGVSATVNVNGLYVRSGPGTSYSIVGQLTYGTKVSCVATSGQWFRITTPSLSGYVYSPYVTLVAPAPAATISRGRTDRKLVSLTFDAGADRGYAGSILDTLAAKGVKASFGMTGGWAGANGDLIQRIWREGHHLINHTRTHRSFTGFSTGAAALTPAERLDELETTEASLKALTGYEAKPWFRPPYGDQEAGVLTDIAADGFRYNVMWTVDSLGWNGLSRDQIVSRILSQHGNGYIYLFHVGSESQDGPALPQIIDGLRGKGYGFGTIPEVVLGTAMPTPTPTATRTPTATATPTGSATPTPSTTVGIFSDDFESGDLSRWTAASGLTVQKQEVASGAYAARGTSTAPVPTQSG